MSERVGDGSVASFTPGDKSSPNSSAVKPGYSQVFGSISNAPADPPVFIYAPGRQGN